MKRANVKSVFKWEFKKHIKNPVFLIFTFLLPAIIALAGVLPGYIIGRTSIQPKDLWVLDETGQLAPLLETALADSRFVVESVQGDIQELKEQVGAGEADALLHITQESLATGSMQLYAKELMDFSRSELEQMLQPAFTQYRLQVSGISPQDFASILTPASVQIFSVSGEEENALAFAIPLFVGMILFISVLFSGQVLMQSVIKEKRNRIVEILLSSLSAGELLAGKVLAFGALTLIQVAIWLGMGLGVAARFVDLSSLGLDYNLLLKALPYFLLGYLLLATLFAALAATMKDAESGSQAHGLVIMIPMLPLMLSAPIMMAPNGIFARVLSYIPIFTPAAMLLRIGATNVPLWEVAVTSVILLVSTALFLRVGARIYQGSLLKFDAAASFREIMAMVRKRES
ncbi:MAG: ABC transporter permease [Bacillota bacterium]